MHGSGRQRNFPVIGGESFLSQERWERVIARVTPEDLPPRTNPFSGFAPRFDPLTAILLSWSAFINFQDLEKSRE
jgi:hypothetical protein